MGAVACRIYQISVSSVPSKEENANASTYRLSDSTGHATGQKVHKEFSGHSESFEREKVKLRSAVKDIEMTGNGMENGQ